MLSRVINDKIRAYEHTTDRKLEYQNQVQMGKLENAWDDDVRRYCGLSIQRDRGSSWMTEPFLALDEVQEKIDRLVKKNRNMALDMYNVMEQERALAEKEKLSARDERHRRNKAKRLARREAEKREEPDLAEPAAMMG